MLTGAQIVSQSPSRNNLNIYKAPRGSNQSMLRGKGPIDFSTISVNEMIRDKLGYVEGYE
jgi:hypothetical protein